MCGSSPGVVRRFTFGVNLACDKIPLTSGSTFVLLLLYDKEAPRRATRQSERAHSWFLYQRRSSGRAAYPRKSRRYHWARTGDSPSSRQNCEGSPKWGGFPHTFPRSVFAYPLAEHTEKDYEQCPCAGSRQRSVAECSAKSFRRN